MFVVVTTCIRIGFRMNVQMKGHSPTASTVLILDANRVCRAAYVEQGQQTTAHRL